MEDERDAVGCERGDERIDGKRCEYPVCSV